MSGGKGARTKRKMKRDQEKKARKTAKNAQYEAWKKAGQNTKSKRARKQTNKRKTISSHDHPDGECGNPACVKCFGLEWRFKPFLTQAGKPKISMPHKMYLKWSTIQER